VRFPYSSGNSRTGGHFRVEDSSGALAAKHEEIPHVHLLERLESIALEMLEDNQFDAPPDCVGMDLEDTGIPTT
jgi:hypothetical protein